MIRESYRRAAIRPPVPLGATPSLAMTVEGLHFLSLDARTAYVLSLVDGRCDVAMILDLVGRELTRDDALDILAHLLNLGAIELREPPLGDVG